MANTTILNRKMIIEIVELLKLRMTWTQIAEAIGVTVQTLKNWRNAGLQAREKKERGIFRELVDAIDVAQTELIKGYSKNVRNAALYGSETETVEEIVHKDGSITSKTVTKKEPPDAKLALKILGMEMPEVWGETHNVVVDWKENLEKQGHDPKKIKALVKVYMKQRAEGTADDTGDDDAVDDNATDDTS